MSTASAPVTYRMLGIKSKTPDASIKCNCKWDNGHESTCDIVAANTFLKKKDNGASEALEQLTTLLPEHLCHFKQGTETVHPCTRAYAIGMLQDALEKGYTIDRSNGDGPLNQWDGWLIVDTPNQQTFIQTNGKIRQD